jgi:hypothetical protein
VEGWWNDTDRETEVWSVGGMILTGRKMTGREKTSEMFMT